MPQAENESTTKKNDVSESKQTSTATTSESEKEGSKFDDLGYEIVKEKKEEEVVETETEKSTEKTGYESEEGETSIEATGYESEPEVKAEVEKKPEEVTEKEKTDETSYKIEDKGDLLDSEVEGLTEFINKHKLPKEVADELVNQKKKEVSDAIKLLNDQKANQAKDAQRIKNEWFKELKEDKDFGGDNFSDNVKKVNKVIEDFLPNLKNKLTNSGTMLPPYVMKDLSQLADHLYSNPTLKAGDPIVTEKEEPEENDPLAYYNS